jgi:HPt (histidine-containing phosphotransfer) domain-containing protein
MTPERDADLPVFDVEVLREVTEIAGIKPLDLIQVFLSELDRNLPLLFTALNCADGTTVEQIAHSLKSSAANVGAMRIAAVARRLEASALTMAELLPQLENLLAELERYRREALPR